LEKNQIAIEKINKDDVQAAVFQALKDIHAEELFTKPNMVILLKPNILMAKTADKAATTHPEIVRSVIRWVKQFKPAKIYVADSSNGINPGYTKKSIKICGIHQVCDEEGATAVAFEETTRETYTVPDPLVLKELTSSILFKEADLIINLPKIKTHGQCTLTCSIKNMFGTMIVGNKAKTHAQFPGINEFSSALADIYSVSKPQLTVVDGYYCQEGRGPASGDVVKLDLVMAGYDPVALDTVACKIIDLEPLKVLHLVKAEQKGLGTMDLSQVQIIGESLEAVKHPFKIPKTASVPFRLPPKLMNYIAKSVFRATVGFDTTKCVRCGTCWHNCPTQAITPPSEMTPGHVPSWDAKKCIMCYCCAETCPHDAVHFNVNIPKNIFTSGLGPGLLLIVAAIIALLVWIF
jgi:uncharacterized protein (DUF362 family)/NAD-dependent dihydropyrimidine dehydrogenase PreA subunit